MILVTNLRKQLIISILALGITLPARCSWWHSLLNYGQTITQYMNKKSVALTAGAIGLLYACNKLHGATKGPFDHETSNNAFEKITPNNMSVPSTIDETCALIAEATKNGHTVSIAGARQSRGNQTTSHRATTMIDTRKLNRIIAIDAQNMLVTVEAGITWKELEDALHTHGLSIITRQSYINFSVGGSIGVNIHGQNTHETMLYDTITSLKVILANGQLVVASRTEKPELFDAIIGGYGLIGLMAEVTLRVTHDCWLRMTTQRMKTTQYADFFKNTIKPDKNIHFHSARLSINPDALFEELISITYSKESQNKDALPELKDTQSLMDRCLLHLIRQGSLGKKVRLPIEERMLKKTKHTSRNNALRDSIENLRPLNNSRDCLQEYFMPCNELEQFLAALKKIVIDYNINLMNVTIRYVKAHKTPLLSYANQDCFALVLYYNIPQEDAAYCTTKKWTQKLIDAAICLGGSFYLPYELLARSDQVLKAYPNFRRFCCTIKNEYDPAHTFTNAFFERYKVTRL